MESNLPKWDRMIRVVVPTLFATLYFSGIVTGGLSIVLSVLGIVFVVTAIVGYCPLTRFLNSALSRADWVHKTRADG